MHSPVVGGPQLVWTYGEQGNPRPIWLRSPAMTAAGTVVCGAGPAGWEQLEATCRVWSGGGLLGWGKSAQEYHSEASGDSTVDAQCQRWCQAN